MPYDDFSISIFLKWKLEYKFIYISIYVHPYIYANVSIKPNWQGLMEFLNVSQENENEFFFKKMI
jgi:hypothetical protein